MCLAIPGEILSADEGDLRMGRVSFGGLVKEVCLACVPEATVGDFVLVHAGFAIGVVSPEHAAEVLAYLARLGEMSGDDVAAPSGEAPASAGPSLARGPS